MEAEAVAGAPPGPNVFILLPWSNSTAEVEAFAAKASGLARSAFAIHAETSADVYTIAQYEGGSCTRRISFSRDAEEPWEVSGGPKAWETDLLLSLTVDDFVGYLSDDDRYAEAELEGASMAHAAHRLDLLSRRPPLLAASLWEWLGKKGIDPRSPHAHLKRRGLLSRLFGSK